MARFLRSLDVLRGHKWLCSVDDVSIDEGVVSKDIVECIADERIRKRKTLETYALVAVAARNV